MSETSERAKSMEIHESAVEGLVAAAMKVPDERWHESRDGNKWSASQIVEHLISTYDILLAELRGKPGMEIRTSFWQRVLLRFFLVPRLLSGGPFPEGARAPKETRPVEREVGKGECLGLFRERSCEFEKEALSASPRQRITHAYFGSASVANGILLCARHIQHHRAQLDRTG